MAQQAPPPPPPAPPASPPPPASPAPPASPQAARPPRRRGLWWRLPLKLVKWLVVAVVVLLGVVLLLLQTDFARDKVRELVLDTLNGGIRGRVELDRLGGTLPFDLTLEGVRIFAPDGALALSVERLEADVHPFDLIDRTVHLSDLRIEAPRVRLLDDAGQVGIARAFAPKTPSPPDPQAPAWTVHLERIRLDDGLVDQIFDDPDVRLRDLAVDVSFRLGERGLQWRDLAVNTGAEAPLPPRITVRSDGRLVGDYIVLDRLEIDASPHRMVARGRIDVATLATLELELETVDVDLDALPAGLLPPALSVGQAELSGFITRADQVTSATLSAASNLGRLELQVGLDDVGAVPSYQGAVRFSEVRPGLLGHGLPEDFLADGGVTFYGVGDPAAPERFHAEGELIERAPSPGGRVAFVVDRPPGPSRGLAAAGARFDVRLDVAALMLAPWLPLAGEPGLSARIDDLELEGQLIVPPSGPARLVLGGTFDLGAEGWLAAAGEEIMVPFAYGDVDLQWDGERAPIGQVSLSLDAARVGQREVSFLDLNLAVSHGKRPGALRVRGVAGADGLVLARDVSFGRLFVPLDLELSPGAVFPQGRLEIDASQAVVAGQRAAQVDGAFRIRPAPGGARVVGGWSASGLQAPAGGARVAGAVGRVDAFVGKRGDVEGDVDLRLTRLAAGGGARAFGVQVTAKVAASRGADGGPKVTGSFGAQGVRVGADVSVARVAGDFDLSLAGGEPVGAVTGVRATGVEAGGRAIERVDASANLQPGGAVAYDVRLDSGALSASLLGVVTLPVHEGRRLDASLDRLVVERHGTGRRRRDTERLLVAEQLRFVEGGLLEVGDITLSGPKLGSGTVGARGTIDPATGTLDLTLASSEDVRIGEWLDGARELGGVALSGLPSLGGLVSVDARLRGTFDAPALSLTVGLSRGRVDDMKGLSVLVGARVADGKISADLGMTWHDEGIYVDEAHGGPRERRGGGLQLTATLPGRVSLSPAGIAWDQGGAVDLVLSAWDADLSASQRFFHGVRGEEPPSDRRLEGRARLDLVVGGPLARPAVALTGEAAPLALGGLRGGRLTVGGSSHADRTRLEVSLVEEGAQDRVGAKAGVAPPTKLFGVLVDAPFDVAQVITSAAPMAYMRNRAATRDGRLRLLVPKTRLAATPLAPHLSEALSALSVAVDFDAKGTLRTPTLEDGFIAVDGLSWEGVDLAVRLGLASEAAGDVALSLAGSARGRELVSGSARLPDVGTVLVDLDDALRILEDPRLRLLVQTTPLQSGELWDLDPGLGELATTFLPGGRIRVGLDARGAPGGPTAMVLGRMRAGRPPPRGEDVAAVTSVVQSIADDVLIKAAIDAERVTVRVRLDQRADYPQYLELRGEVPVGTAALVARPTAEGGAEAVVEEVVGSPRFSASLVADEFRLDGIAGGMDAVLGPSRGLMRGKVGVEGTVDEPKLAGSLDLYFEELNVEPIGFHRDHLTALLLMSGDTLELAPIRLEEQASGGEPAFFELAMKAVVSSLSGEGVALDGYVEMDDFALLDRKDMRGRFDARIDVDGTVAEPSVVGEVEVLSAYLSPDLGGRSVRSLGLPKDVTLVSGAPEPPPDRAVRTGFKTGAAIDVKLSMPKGRVKIDNDMLNLSPWSDLMRARTVEGELVLTGTVHVPDKHITLYEREFVLTEDSRVVFSGDPSVDPLLRVTAKYDISEVDLSPLGLIATAESRVTVAITGNAGNPKLKLSSDPPMDESNIISVIVMGTPAGPGETEENALRTQVANLVIGMATGRLSQLLTSQLPIDTFQLDTSGGDLTKSRLTVGKRLAKDLFFRYRMNMGADEKEESVNEFSAEYRVGPMTLLGEYGDIGEFSLEARLRLRD